MLTSRLAIAAVLATFILPLAQPAAADGRGNGNGAAGCPPGLAKKNPPCVPPGLARNGTTPEDWAAERGYDLGDLIDDEDDDHDDDDDDDHDDDDDDDDHDDDANRLTLRDLILRRQDGESGDGDRSRLIDLLGSGGGENRTGDSPRLTDLVEGGQLGDDDPIMIRDPERFGLASDSEDFRYFLVRDQIVGADPKSGRILRIIGLAENILK